MSEAKRDNNYIPTLLAVSNADSETPVVIEADPTTKRLLVDVSGGAGSSAIDDAAFTPGSSSLTLAGGFFDDVTPDSVDEGDGGVFRMSARREMYVQIRDAAGNERGLNIDGSGQLSVAVGGDALTALQLIDDPVFADDAAFTLTSSKVMMAGAIRNDSLTTLTAVEGDSVPFRVSSTGALHVTGGGGGTEYTEDVTTADPQVGSAIMVERDDALTAVTPVEGDWIGLRGSAEGALWVQEFNSDAILTDTANMDTNLGTIAGAISSAKMQVEVLSVIPGTGATSLGKAEDEAHTTGDTGVPILAVRRDTAAVGSDTDGDYSTLNVDASGRLYTSTTIDAALPAGTNAIGKLSVNSGVDIGDVDVTSITGVTMSNDAIQTTGDEAHDAPDAGNPVKVGAKAYAFDGTIPQTAVAEADRVNLISDLQGIQYVQTAHPRFWHVSADYGSTQTNATVKTAPGAGLKLYITDVIVSNGATAGNITLLDGSGGTVLLELYPAINGGMTHSFKNPLVLTANTLLAITSTTVTTHSVTISGFIAA